MKFCWCEVKNIFDCCEDCEDSGSCRKQCPVYLGQADESQCKGDEMFHED